MHDVSRMCGSVDAFYGGTDRTAGEKLTALLNLRFSFYSPALSSHILNQIGEQAALATIILADHALTY